MNISPVLREGINAARNGDFTLLDCLELIERHQDKSSACAVMRWDGRTLIGYNHCPVGATYENTECPACEGMGELTATGANDRDYAVNCPECCGDGEVPGDEGAYPVPEFFSIKWRDLDDVDRSVSMKADGGMPKYKDIKQALQFVSDERYRLAAVEAKK